MALTSGTKLGPYEIQSPLGAGGMGEVYRAKDTRLDRTVAVKILPAHLSSNPEAKQRFEREARAISSLNHPHICTLYDVGHQAGTDYLVMEFLEGETLADRLRKGPLPLQQVLKYGIEIGQGLERAHRTGVVRRDLKPGNIMLTKSGAKLMDFGLAKATPPIAPSSSGLSMTQSTPVGAHPLTTQGTIVGTFQYMAPEQIEGKEADARSDIFAFGAVLYEMVTGKRAFEGKSQLSVASAILERDPAPISAASRGIPPALERTIAICLTKDPERRWSTAHDVMLQLTLIANAEDGTSKPTTGRLTKSHRICHGARCSARGRQHRRPRHPLDPAHTPIQSGHPFLHLLSKRRAHGAAQSHSDIGNRTRWFGHCLRGGTPSRAARSRRQWVPTRSNRDN